MHLKAIREENGVLKGDQAGRESELHGTRERLARQERTLLSMQHEMLDAQDALKKKTEAVFVGF